MDADLNKLSIFYQTLQKFNAFIIFILFSILFLFIPFQNASYLAFFEPFWLFLQYILILGLLIRAFSADAKKNAIVGLIFVNIYSGILAYSLMVMNGIIFVFFWVGLLGLLLIIFSGFFISFSIFMFSISYIQNKKNAIFVKDKSREEDTHQNLAIGKSNGGDKQQNLAIGKSNGGDKQQNLAIKKLNIGETNAGTENRKAWALVDKKYLLVRRISTILILISTISMILFFQPGILSPTPIEIEPKDYQIKFAFWADYTYTHYSDQQKAMMNKYKVRLTVPINYIYDPILHEINLERFNFWKENYPDISFHLLVPGFPGGYMWDGAFQSVEYAKDLVIWCKQNNLTNVKGIAFDFEYPLRPQQGEYSTAANRSRHELMTQKLNEFFDWLDGYAPGFEIEHIHWSTSFTDLRDGDLDLHLIEKTMTADIDRWTKYAPMIYRSWNLGFNEYGYVPKPLQHYLMSDSAWFYKNLNDYLDLFSANGKDISRLSVYMGVTNLSSYSADHEIYEHGAYIGKGFDVLLRDILICKHFRIPEITFFTLSSASEGTSLIGGMFECYGENFLDVMNETVNGANSTNVFEIYAGSSKFDYGVYSLNYFDVSRDWIFNGDSPILLLLFVVSIYLMLKKSIKY